MPSKLLPTILPVAALLLAATLWGLLWYPLRLLNAQGLPSVWVALVGYGAAFVVGGIYLGRNWEQWSRRPGVLVALALASGWCNISFIVAVAEGLVVRVVLLFYLSPLWAVLLGRVILKERLTRSTVAVLILAMTGAMIMLWDPRIGIPWPQGRADWLAISAGFAFALSNVLVRLLQEVVVAVKLVSNLLGGVAVAVVWITVVGDSLPHASTQAWWGAAALGVFGLILMTVSVQYGVTHMPIYRSAVILLFELVVAAVSAQVLANEVPHSREWIGGTLIIAASLMSARAEAKRHESNS